MPLDKVIRAMRELRAEEKAENLRLTSRSFVAETRHWCLYASQELTELREIVLRPGMTPVLAAFQLGSTMAKLEALYEYLTGDAYAPLHPNELAGAGAQSGIKAEMTARVPER